MGDLEGRTFCIAGANTGKEPSEAATPELAAELWARSEEWVADFR